MKTAGSNRRVVDLRSDTVTLPTEAMRRAMRDAKLGDDVFGEDPTVNQLEKISAAMMGKEAALLVPSGTMANLVGVLSYCGRGEEAILGDQSHTYYYEAGGISAVGSVHPRVVANQPDGTMRLSDIESAIRPENLHFPHTRLICLENTHNRCRGAVLGPGYINSVCDLAGRYGLKVHIDGARIFNAAVALGVDVKELVNRVDSVSFCMSKGLSAPVGSVVCGSGDFIYRARRLRKCLGGGMRQSGVIAAAGIVALEQMIGRLCEDHANAKRLAEGLSKIEGICVDIGRVATNMVFFETAGHLGKDREKSFVEGASGQGVLFLAVGPGTYRMVAHYGIEAEDIDFAVRVVREVFSKTMAG